MIYRGARCKLSFVARQIEDREVWAIISPVRLTGSFLRILVDDSQLWRGLDPETEPTVDMLYRSKETFEVRVFSHDQEKYEDFRWDVDNLGLGSLQRMVPECFSKTIKRPE